MTDIFGLRRSFLACSKEERHEFIKPFICIIGISYLFPFPALTQCVDYWDDIFPDYDTDFWISAISLWTMFLTLMTCIYFFPLSERPTREVYAFRMYLGSFGQLISFIIIPLCDIMRYRLDLFGENVHFALIIGVVVLCSLSTGVLDSIMISYVSNFHEDYQNTLQLGVGCCNLIAACYSVITKASVPSSMTSLSAYLYFLMAILTSLSSMTSFVFLQSIFDVMAIYSTDRDGHECAHIHGNVVHDDSGTAHHNNEHVSLIPAAAQTTLDSMSEDQYKEQEFTVATENIWARRYQAIRPVLRYEVMMSLTFAITLLLWPSMVASIESSYFSSWNDNGWWDTMLLFLFAVCDVTGRQTITVTNRFGITAKNLWIPVCLRLLFIPLLFGAVLQSYLTQDYVVVPLVMLLGYSYGYLATLAIMIVNEETPPMERPFVGGFTCVFIHSGLVFGASIALILELVGVV